MNELSIEIFRCVTLWSHQVLKSHVQMVGEVFRHGLVRSFSLCSGIIRGYKHAERIKKKKKNENRRNKKKSNKRRFMYIGNKFPG